MLTDLMTREIGKRYLWKASAIECLCSQCGTNRGYGDGQEDSKAEVTVLAKANDYDEKPKCAVCGAVRTEAELEGWFAVVGPFWIATVPYTQLHELEEENASRQ